MKNLKLIYANIQDVTKTLSKLNKYGINIPYNLIIGSSNYLSQQKLSYEKTSLYNQFKDYMQLSSFNINLNDLSSSTNLILYEIWYNIFKKHNKSITLLEFECGINNKQQCIVIDFIINLLNKNLDIQFNIITNSEVVLNRIGRHIVEDNFNNENIVILLQHKNTFNKCLINQEGIVTGWIDGFFEGENLIRGN